MFRDGENSLRLRQVEKGDRRREAENLENSEINNKIKEMIIKVNKTGYIPQPQLPITVSEIDSVMNFDGTDDWIAFTPTGCIDVCTNRKMTFQMILDAPNGFNNNGLFNFRNPVGLSSPGDSWEAQLDGSMLHVDIGSGGYKARYALEDFPLGEIFTIEFIKSISSIDSLKINGIEITRHGPSQSTTSTNSSALGRVGIADYYLKSASIWDVEIRNNDDQTLLHSFRGYGADANTAAAWVDDTSNAVPEVHGDPSIRRI
jgi:hypothetical protein